MQYKSNPYKIQKSHQCNVNRTATTVMLTEQFVPYCKQNSCHPKETDPNSRF